MDYGTLGAHLMFLNLLRRNRMHRLSCGYPLHNGQLPILEALLCHPGSTQQELADFLHVTPASIALSTKRLQKAGLIEKRVDETNRRCNRLYATPQGAALSRQFCTYRDTVDAETFAGFSPAELAAFSALLERMIDNMNTEQLSIFPTVTKEDK